MSFEWTQNDVRAFDQYAEDLEAEERCLRELRGAITTLTPLTEQQRTEMGYRRTWRDESLRSILRDYWRELGKLTAAFLYDATRTWAHKAFWFLCAGVLVAGVAAVSLWIGGM